MLTQDSPVSTESTQSSAPSTIREAAQQAISQSENPEPNKDVSSVQSTEQTTSSNTQDAPEHDKGNLEPVDINSLPTELQGQWKELYAGYTRARQKDRAEVQTANQQVTQLQEQITALNEQIEQFQQDPQQYYPSQQQTVDQVQDPDLAAQIANMTPYEYHQFMLEQMQQMFEQKQQDIVVEQQEAFEDRALSDFESLDERLNPDNGPEIYDDTMRLKVGTELDRLYEEHKAKTGSYDGFDYVTHAKRLIQEYDKELVAKHKRFIERQSKIDRQKAGELNKFSPTTSGGVSSPSGKMSPREAAEAALAKLS